MILKINKLNAAITIGLIAIIGILVAQLLWTKQAFTLEDRKFGQKVQIALLEVAKKLYEGTNHELPAENPVKKISNDYYIVNIDNDFEPEILEFYLKTEFVKSNISTDFEYAVYNCQSDEMVYGNYVSNASKLKKKSKVYFPKHKNLVYYFAIQFPNQTNYLLQSLRFWIVLSVVLILILLLYCYSIFMLLQQRKYAELQNDFINNMTHEFKTPLSSILIASNFLRNQKPIYNDKKLFKYNQIIIDQGEKLNNHVEKILSMSKNDFEPFTMNLVTLDILKIINNTAENVLLKYQNASLSLKNNTNSSEILVKTDALHFANLIYNLLDNAMKYCLENPIIIIEISENENSLLLSIADNGIGIPADKTHLIFDKFTRLQTEKSKISNGFGLGLYYVKKICKHLNWDISVKSNMPQGSIFLIQIPHKK